MNINNKINKDNIPEHIAFIMDGNGRWAKSQGEHRVYGHKSGVNTVRVVTEAARDVGVKYITLYAFSTENWGRPEEEVSALMKLLVDTLQVEIPKMIENNVILNFIGKLEDLPESNQEIIRLGLEATKNNTGLTLTIALNYSSRQEIVIAMKNIAKDIEKGKIKSEEVTDDLISQHLYTYDMPDPELLIRTSGELRISNFLLWQIAYTELLFSDVYWPDFSREDFFQAIIEYQNRQRRFGKTDDQIKPNSL